ncbi:MAG: DUF3427 domain-containing protein [Chitinophaga sp.]|uniref:DUF3427 domain-containing protein n=1 Tax=Chitinophaga sp. TaxID=1869181 RepID=UPI0025C0D4D1|nr:DUF3427 domain-containing protein [Chitinophaga sp.]MBV8251940.1 DUF3427 domain-containing protein [Chitinophaga sp.]
MTPAFITQQLYTKADIYRLLQVPSAKQKGSWNTGYTKYEHNIYLFVNIGVPGRSGHDYDNHWENEDLVWYGKTNSHKDQPLIREMLEHECPVHLFTREHDRDAFKYIGIIQAKTYVDVSPIQITWSIANPINHLRPAIRIHTATAWQLLMHNAQDAQQQQESLFCPFTEKEYWITAISNTAVELQSTDATPILLHKRLFAEFIQYLNTGLHIPIREAGFQVPLTTLAAIVWLLPYLDWDEHAEHILFDEELVPSTPTLTEAQNDEGTTPSNRRSRAGQNKFKDKLLSIYGGQCCITKCNVKAALHACHIEPHAVRGFNHSINGLLLRLDIHALWDKNLIGIHPETRKIHIKEALRNTEYQQLEHIQIAPRKDGRSLYMIGLKNRWQEFLK